MIIIDTNIIISALIKDSITRKIIIESGLSFAYPEISIMEIRKYEEIILKKSGYSKEEFELILNKLLEYINLIPIGLINNKLNEAKEIMLNIDINDAIFIAAALSFKSQIWSDDSDFDKQNKIKIIKTKDMIKLFEK